MIFTSTKNLFFCEAVSCYCAWFAHPLPFLLSFLLCTQFFFPYPKHHPYVGSKPWCMSLTSSTFLSKAMCDVASSLVLFLLFFFSSLFSTALFSHVIFDYCSYFRYDRKYIFFSVACVISINARPSYIFSFPLYDSLVHYLYPFMLQLYLYFLALFFS